VFASLASLTGEGDPAPLVGQATAEVSGLTVTVRWADGTRTVVDFGDGVRTLPTVTEVPA
jgi:hypothetical protein